MMLLEYVWVFTRLLYNFNSLSFDDRVFVLFAYSLALDADNISMIYIKNDDLATETLLFLCLLKQSEVNCNLVHVYLFTLHTM